jgi:RES domain-containing protein
MGFRPDGGFTAFRVSQRKFASFDGRGAALQGSRWNTIGQFAIYGAESYAGAILEILAHATLGRVPQDFAWIRIDIPPGLAVERTKPENVPGWEQSGYIASQGFGGQWYVERRTAVLLVPSVTTNGIESNVVINQEHPEFSRITASAPQPVKWDNRLFARRELLQ